MAGAMRYPTLFCGVFLLAATALASSATRQRQPCRCLPTQWEGVLKSRRRIINLSTGKWRISDQVWTMHYDYRQNKLVAMLSTDGKKRIIADSSKGFTYMLSEAGCHAIPTGVKPERKCEPASPDAVKYFNLANGRAVVRWQHTGPVNTTIRTTVALDNCMPVAQDVYSTYRGFVMVVTSVFSQVRRGIEDRLVFDMPPECKILDVDVLGIDKRSYRAQAFPAAYEGTPKDAPAFL